VLIIFATPASVYLFLRVFRRVAEANHGKWWWPLVVNAGVWLPWMIVAIASFAHGRRHAANDRVIHSRANAARTRTRRR
jgi:4-amino-4-deoxy-L-arabinose transferase-like glycosyltransferase